MSIIYTEPSHEEEQVVIRCPVCGGTSLEWGTVTSHVPTWFMAGPTRKIRLFAQQPETRARLCLSCGNVQIFVNPE